MFPLSFLRLRARPAEKGPPPRNFVDVAYDTESNTIKAINSADEPVMFDAEAPESSTAELAAAPGELAQYSALGGLTAWDRVKVKGVEIPGSEVTLTPFIISFTDGDNDSLGFEAPFTFGGTFVYALPLANGTMAVLREYADSTAANAAVSIGDVWWDTTLKKARVRMS